MNCPTWCVYHAAPAHRWHRGDAYDDAGRLAGQVFQHGDGPLQVTCYGRAREAAVFAAVLGTAAPSRGWAA